MTVLVIATGGTISSSFDGTDWTGISGAQLVDEAGPHPVDVVVEDIAAGPSSHLGVDDMSRIAQRIRTALTSGVAGVERIDGVVVTHGTDTIELTAFVTELLLGVDAQRRPVVFTGSMRVHSHPQPDGPQNLRDAIAVAADPAAVGREVLVCLDGAVHAAEHLVKVNANSVDAFSSAPFAPVGTISDAGSGRRVVFDTAPTWRPAAEHLAADVALLSCWPGIDADEFTRLAAGRRGVVVEAFGDLNVPEQLWRPVYDAAQAGVLVVFASRPFTATRTNDGLALMGAVGAGGLTAQKARLATMAALAGGADRDQAISFLQQYALSYDAGDRRTSA